MGYRDLTAVPDAAWPPSVASVNDVPCPEFPDAAPRLHMDSHGGNRLCRSKTAMGKHD